MTMTHIAQTIRRRPMVLRLLLVVSLLAVLGSAAGVNADPSGHVLVLNSYHHGLSWTDSIVQGIMSVLGGDPDLELHIEYMDTKRLYDEVHLQNLYEVYKYKYSQMRFEAVMVSDNNAFEFVRQHHDDLFPGTPVVFCGVNEQVSGVFDVTGLDRIFKFTDDISTALATIQLA